MLTRLKQWFAVLICLGALALQVGGQTLPESFSKEGAQEPPPPFGILDQEGFFSRDVDAMKRISDKIRKLEQTYNFRIFLVVQPSLLTSTAQKRATELRENWVPDGNGIVVFFESDSRNLGIARDLIGDSAKSLPASALVPSYQMASIINRTLETTDVKLAPESYVTTLMEKMLDSFQAYFESRQAPPPAARKMKIGLLVAGTFALVGLGAIGLGGLVRHFGMGVNRVYRFPVVDRPERLGAPCGGSVIARRFAAPETRS